MIKKTYVVKDRFQPDRNLFCAEIENKRFSMSTMHKMSLWCLDQFGAAGPWFEESYCFYFYHPEDLMLFTLRWA